MTGRLPITLMISPDPPPNESDARVFASVTYMMALSFLLTSAKQNMFITNWKKLFIGMLYCVVMLTAFS